MKHIIPLIAHRCPCLRAERRKHKMMSGSSGSPVHQEALRAALCTSESGCHTEMVLTPREQTNMLLLVTLLKDEMALMHCLDPECNNTLMVSEGVKARCV